MPFTLDNESLLIKGRRGDTASFTFNFNKDMSSYSVYFYIQKNIYSPDVILEKKYDNIVGSSLIVNLSSEDTSKLMPLSNSYNTYYWGVKIASGTEFVQTLIPQEFANPPILRIYPEVGGV